jgi:hypothetical protein
VCSESDWTAFYSRLVICRIFGLLVRIFVVDDMFTARQDVPKSCALVLLQHSLSSCGIHRKIHPFLMRPCAILVLRHYPRLRLIQYKIANTMEQNPSWKANRSSASQEIPRKLWNPKVHFRIHNSPPPVPILDQTNPFHAPTPQFLKTRFSIIILSKPRFPKWSPSIRSLHQNPVCTYRVPHPC